MVAHLQNAQSCVVSLYELRVNLLTELSRVPRCIAPADRVALFNRTGLRGVATQEFARNGFVPMTKGFCSVMCIATRLSGRTFLVGVESCRGVLPRETAAGGCHPGQVY